MTAAEIISIIAILLSPAIAVGVSAWISEKMRWRNYQKEREDRVLENLIAFRYVVHSSQFLSALNSVIYVFHEDEKIKGLVKNLHRAYGNRENITIINQRIVELIHEICKYKKYKITEYEIQNLFQPTVQPMTPGREPSLEQSHNPTSTPTSSSESEEGVQTTSIALSSITAGSLGDKDYIQTN